MRNWFILRRIVQGSRFQANSGTAIVNHMVDSSAALGTKRAFLFTSIVGNSGPEFEPACNQFKIVRQDPHRQAKGASRLFLTIMTVAGVKRYRLSPHPVANIPTLTLATQIILSLVHLDCSPARNTYFETVIKHCPVIMYSSAVNNRVLLESILDYH